MTRVSVLFHQSNTHKNEHTDLKFLLFFLNLFDKDYVNDKL